MMPSTPVVTSQMASCHVPLEAAAAKKATEEEAAKKAAEAKKKAEEGTQKIVSLESALFISAVRAVMF